MNNLENEIIKAAKNHPGDVPTHLWNRLDAKLHDNKQNKKIKRYKYISVAASFVACAAVSTFLYYNSYKWNPQILAYSSSKNLILEDLLPLEDDFYNPQKIALLHNTASYKEFHGK
jgi:hypothetical protein